MYFFDFFDFCYSQDIGSNSNSMFLSPVGTRCSDMATTFRANRDAHLLAVGRWYDLSNPQTKTYQYNSGGSLSWPTTAGYTLYTGGFTSFDDGYTSSPILLPTTYSMNGVESVNLYVGTNGYFTLGSGSNTNLTVPSVGPPATICANPGDNWLQPGLANSDTTTQNLWYTTRYDGNGKHCVSLLVFGGIYGSTILNKTPSSWYANFYRDARYQWLEVGVKSTSTIQGKAGPYNASSDVSVLPSTTTKVWRGDLTGTLWTYMGNGYVSNPLVTPRVCPECDTYYNQYTAMTSSTSAISNFWLDAETNFVNTTQANFTTYIQNVYHQECVLRQLIKCVDGDDFTTFDI